MRNLIIVSLMSLGSVLVSNAESSTEKILGYQPTKTGVVFQVTSGGCTQREDFTTALKRSDTNVIEITLIRSRPDECLPYIPTGMRFKLSYDELGLYEGEHFTITNPNGVVYGSAWDLD